MQLRNFPEDVVPLFKTNLATGTKHFLGTGFFLKSPPVLVTAYHVIRDFKPPYHAGVVDSSGNISSTSMCTLDLQLVNTETDLAILIPTDHTPSSYIIVNKTTPIILNQPVICFEYSGTHKEKNSNEYRFEPACRTGNICRIIDRSDIFGLAGIRMLEVSFPALSGASGAPILVNPISQSVTTSVELVGIITANEERELLPSQIITTLDDNNKLLEEIKYMVPQGLAINKSHLFTPLEEFEAKNPSSNSA